MDADQPSTAFVGERILARGRLADVALAVRNAGAAAGILVFSDETGRVIDLDLRGSAEEIVARLAPPARGRGRPKLGVVAREVTLLPRHWEWLGRQRGGASHALRRLVDGARNADQAQPHFESERAYRFMSALAGNLPGFEEASRALFAGDGDALAARTADWPKDIRAYALELVRPADHNPNG
ncbi:DUF2239 family protein [Allosphingosinicella deserti]|uniref:DUF2239 domain-containing protein n=1 Tax=Allosphingosinicella deserti TaxID=2116704 RepID=A0A2P7QRZ0_9SPHN|nr:DUF2239 family protein [Sphingomonas deserti]PSJ40736.1 DUF2239 domain-containing protein [Sphingomonas deserti]